MCSFLFNFGINLLSWEGQTICCHLNIDQDVEEEYGEEFVEIACRERVGVQINITLWNIFTPVHWRAALCALFRWLFLFSEYVNRINSLVLTYFNVWRCWSMQSLNVADQSILLIFLELTFDHIAREGTLGQNWCSNILVPTQKNGLMWGFRNLLKVQNFGPFLRKTHFFRVHFWFFLLRFLSLCTNRH